MALPAQGALRHAHRAVEIPLAPLASSESRELLDRLAPPELDEADRDEIVTRAEGNPLYVEELLAIVLEGGSIGRRRAWTGSVLTAAQLSPALQTLLVARIDLLSPGARRLAQIAAVIGRSFAFRVLERVAEGESVEADLTVLLRQPEREYTFKHGLMQEAALSTLTRQRRAELHARVAAAYEQLYGGALEDLLERLAHHHAQSEDLPRALAYLEAAAAKAASLDAGTRASELWQRAQRVAETRRRRGRRTDREPARSARQPLTHPVRIFVLHNTS